MKQYTFEWFTKSGNLCKGTLIALNDHDALQRANEQCSANGWTLSRVFIGKF